MKETLRLLHAVTLADKEPGIAAHAME